MNPSPPDAARPHLEVRGARSSSVIVQRIPPDSADSFMEWQRGITAAVADFPGYQSTEIYPPMGQQQEWVIVLHFDDSKSLQAWLASPKRAEWVAKLPCQVRDYRVRMLPSGFGAWFAGLSDEGASLPHWKKFLTVLAALYPTVMLLTIFLTPYTAPLGMAVALLIGNVASVAFLEWLGMPVFSRLIGPWLRARGKEGRRLNLIGLVLIVAALGVLAALFRLVTG